MKNAEQMTADLQTVYEQIRSGAIPLKEAAEMNNCVGKMIGLAKAQLEYHALRKESPRMAFFESSAPQGS